MTRSPASAALLWISVAATAFGGLTMSLAARFHPGSVAPIALSVSTTWAAFVASLIPLGRLWGGSGLALVRAYLVGAAVRVVAGLGASLLLIAVADQPPTATLLAFAGAYLAMMHAEVAVLVRWLRV